MREVRFCEHLLGRVSKIKDQRSKIENVMIAILVGGVALGALAFLLSGRIVRFAALRYCGANISYSKMYPDWRGKVIVRDLDITLPEKNHIGLTARRAVFVLWPGCLSRKSPEVSFDLKDVRFKKGPERPVTPLDAMSGLMFVPFEGSWRYSQVYGTVAFEGRTIRVRGLNARGDDIRVNLSGALLPDNTVDGAITVFFSRNAAARFPEELSNVVLQEEEDGWRSFSVKLQGDYRSPSIQLSGKLFRLNITNK